MMNIMSNKELLELVKEKFSTDPELRKYLAVLDTTKLSSATLANFLTGSSDYIHKYFFWVQ